ncbi:MAG: ImmA/IrrE family metallo-endopeptidase [Nitrospiraceae bacterium]|nr:ImmA/IrrE family metallo-endopeptidase [Nitrospiraceae bacterium]
MREVARLSWSNRGPLLAQEFLANHGIALIIEPQLPKTAMDGGAMMSRKRPVIGLTLRYDRIDSFWFTLIHELVHVAKHLKRDGDIYIDDLDSKFDDPKEKEADLLTGDILIPRRIWKTSRANIQKTPGAINELARHLGIHPAVVAGKIRFENQDYSILNEFVGHNQVKKLFSKSLGATDV